MKNICGGTGKKKVVKVLSENGIIFVLLRAFQPGTYDCIGFNNGKRGPYSMLVEKSDSEAIATAENYFRQYIEVI